MRGVSCLPRNLDCVTSPKNFSSFSLGKIYLRYQTYFWQKFVQDVLTLLCSIISNVQQHPVQLCFSLKKALNGFQLNRATISHPACSPPLTGDRQLPYGFFFLQNDSSCLFPTGRGSLRMSPSPTGCGTTSPTGSHTGDRTSTAPGVPLACAPPKLFSNHFFTGNVPHLRLET